MVTRLYPTLKAMEVNHAEARSEKVSQNLTALIEYAKNWNDGQQVKGKIAFLKSIGPPYYSPDGTPEEHDLFFSRYVRDEELQTIFR